MVGDARIDGLPDPKGIHTRAELAGALYTIKGNRSYADLTAAAYKLIATADHSPRRFPWSPRELPKSSVADWLAAGRSLPSPDKLMTFLTVCEVPSDVMPAWLEALDRVRKVKTSEHAAASPVIAESATKASVVGSSRPPRRWHLVWAGAAVVSAGIITAAITLTPHTQAPTPASGDSTPPASSESSTLTLYDTSTFFYPRGGTLPTAIPPSYPSDHQLTHCGDWVNYFADIGAVPTEPKLFLTTIANSTSPVTILDLKIDVYATEAISSKKRIQCTYGAGGYTGATVSVDLEHPTRPTPLDNDGDGNSDTTLPGGRFVVAPNNAENLTILLKGKAGEVYEFGVRMQIVENGRERSIVLGDRGHPHRIAIESTDGALSQDPKVNPNENFDWNFATGGWAPADEHLGGY